MKTEKIPFPSSATVAWTNSVGRSGSGAAAAITSGMVLVAHGLWAIAFGDIATSAVGQVKTQGVFEIPKNSGVAYAVGQRLGYDFTNNYATTDLTGLASGTLQVVEAAASADLTVKVRLNVPHLEFIQAQRATTAGEQTNNYIDVDLGVVASGCIVVSANLYNSSRVRRAFSSYTKNPGGSSPNVIRLSETDIASGDTVEYVIKQLASA